MIAEHTTADGDGDNDAQDVIHVNATGFVNQYEPRSSVGPTNSCECEGAYGKPGSTRPAASRSPACNHLPDGSAVPCTRVRGSIG